MKIPFSKIHITFIHIELVPDKYYIKPIKKQLKKLMAAGHKIQAIKVLRDFSKENGHQLTLRECKDFVEDTFPYPETVYV